MEGVYGKEGDKARTGVLVEGSKKGNRRLILSSVRISFWYVEFQSLNTVS